MENTSPFLAMQRVERLLKGVLRSLDTDMLDRDEKKAVVNIKRLVVDARIDIRDYELSETREEQLKKATAAKKRIAKLQANILAASMAFGPVDVAQISAQLEQIEARLV